ncbi:hypothetical protein PA598K_01257 [Paenibacillus sp. 598K]|uniref:M56 family metallopeptidase n=1 Tax=Paenibacillus sp. 598K TaxID=1117987 RepID=UPI000FF95B5A|nr:M56 family metallopeptidase [Paenibacillus sp. 598K]GBF72975.1 hypothetical protein PA598K_01257 [Paenibacillus sp. 598K]
MTTIIAWLISLTVAGSIGVACALLLTALPLREVPARWRYRMQRLALLLYLLPLAALAPWLIGIVRPWLIVPEPLPAAPYAPLYGGAEPQEAAWLLPAPVAIALLIVWLAGALVYAGRQFYRYRRFVRILASSSAPLPPDSEASIALHRAQAAMSMRRRVRLVSSDLLHTPLLIGLWRPTLYLPRELPADMDLEMTMRHELTHLQQHDLWTKALMLCASALHWFNPLVHMLQRHIQTWSELSCDEAAVQPMSPSERKRYGQTILSVSAGNAKLPTPLYASLSPHGQQLKRRLTLMMNSKPTRKKTFFLLSGTLLIAGIVGTSAAVWAADYAPAVDYKSEPYTSQSKEIGPDKQTRPDAASKLQPDQAATDAPAAAAAPAGEGPRTEPRDESQPREVAPAAEDPYLVPTDESQATKAAPTPGGPYLVPSDEGAASVPAPSVDSPSLVPSEVSPASETAPVAEATQGPYVGTLVADTRSEAAPAASPSDGSSPSEIVPAEK